GSFRDTRLCVRLLIWFVASGELAQAVFTEQRFGGIDKVAFRKQALGHVIAGFDNYWQRLIGLGSNQIRNSLLDPVPRYRLGQWHGLKDLIEGLERLEDLAFHRVNAPFFLLSPFFHVHVY